MDEPKYAVYKGDTFLVMGTADQCALQLGISPKTIRWYSRPAAHRRAKEHPDRRMAIRL